MVFFGLRWGGGKIVQEMIDKSLFGDELAVFPFQSCSQAVPMYYVGFPPASATARVAAYHEERLELGQTWQELLAGITCKILSTKCNKKLKRRQSKKITPNAVNV